MKISHYAPSTNRNSLKAIINAGTSNDNVKIISTNTLYNNPKFFPRKFEKWPDQFEVSQLKDGNISVRRTDVSVGGWGESLLIDVEHENKNTSAPKLKEQTIPRVIYQTFETHDVPNGMAESINGWRETNSEYEHYFYDAEERVEFIEKFFPKEVLHAYLNLIPGAFKADLWRCCILYEKGGVYVDADMVCLKRLNDYINVDDTFIISRDDPISLKYLANGFIASIPKHPFLNEQINSIVQNVKERKNCYYLQITGPALFGQSVNKVCGRDIHSEYDLGENNIGGNKFKLMLHDWRTKTMSIGAEQVLMTEYNKKLDEMNSIKNPTFYSLYQKGMVYKQIPRKIYFTTRDHVGINPYMIESFKSKNKYWELAHYTDDECVKFFEKYNNEFIALLKIDALKFYLELINGGERSDFWRYCVLYLFGGVYTDSDTFCAAPIEDWIQNYDMIFGAEAILPLNEARTFGMDAVGQTIGNTVISVCNWTLASGPKNEFYKNLIVDIVENPIKGSVLLNTGPGRLTKHVCKYFGETDYSKLNNQNIEKEKSVLFSINKFGSNQSHSGAYKNYQNPFNTNGMDVYVVHMFDGSWRTTSNKNINIIKSQYETVANMAIIKTCDGYKGVSRYDENFRRTDFMVKIGDCRSVVEMKFDNNFNLTKESIKNITNCPDITKFEDSRFFSFYGKKYISVSYLDMDFNCWVGVLDENYNFLGKVNIDEYNRVSFIGKTRFWEKNWLFFEKDGNLYFIYSTTPRYIVFVCTDFTKLQFKKHIDIEWPLAENVPDNEIYFTGYLGGNIKIATAGTAGPIYIKEKDIYLYFIHTKFYSEKKYNHYAVILDKNLIPINFCKFPIISKYVPHIHLFISSVIETGDYLLISGGIADNNVFTWELSKPRIFKMAGVYNLPNAV